MVVVAVLVVVAEWFAAAAAAAAVGSRARAGNMQVVRAASIDKCSAWQQCPRQYGYAECSSYSSINRLQVQGRKLGSKAVAQHTDFPA